MALISLNNAIGVGDEEGNCSTGVSHATGERRERQKDEGRRGNRGVKK